MNIYLTSRSIPELVSLPEGEREAFWQRCHPKAWRHWQTWLAFFTCMASLAAGFYFTVFTRAEDSFSWVRMLLGAILMVVGSGGFFPVHVAMTRRYIREELSK
jgi:hypothetical protein